MNVVGYDKVKCLICKKQFLRRDKAKRYNRSMPAGRRSHNCKTCSSKCSKELHSSRYRRVKK